MRRDVAVAILAGFILGAVVALAATNLPKIIKEGLKISKNITAPSPTPTPVKSASQNLEFTIDSPQDESVADGKTATFSGRVAPGQTVLIESAADNAVADVDSSGKFSAKLNLAEGLNKFFVTVFEDSGNSNTKTLNVYFTTEKL